MEQKEKSKVKSKKKYYYKKKPVVKFCEEKQIIVQLTIKEKIILFFKNLFK